MAQKILSSSGGFFYINDLAVPKGSIYFKRVEPVSVDAYPLEKDSRLVIGTILVSEAVDGDNGNAPFTYDGLVDWFEMNTAAVAGTGGGGDGGSGTPIDTTNLATRQNQSTQITRETEIRDNVIAVLTKIIANPATADNQTSEINLLTALGNKDFATQATLTAVLQKLSADPATQTTLAAVLAKLSADPATKASIDAITAKLSADPSTATKQEAGNTTLASILAKLIAAPATEANQNALNLLIANIASVKTEVPDPSALRTIQTANVSQVASAAVPAGRFVRIINKSADTLWINLTGPATINTGDDSFPLSGGQTFIGGAYEGDYKITNQINIIGPNANARYSIINY